MAEFQQDIKEALASTLVYFCKTNVKYSEHMTLHATIGLIVDDNAIIVPVAFSHNASYEKRKQQQEINKQQGRYRICPCEGVLGTNMIMMMIIIIIIIMMIIMIMTIIIIIIIIIIKKMIIMIIILVIN